MWKCVPVGEGRATVPLRGAAGDLLLVHLWLSMSSVPRMCNSSVDKLCPERWEQ